MALKLDVNSILRANSLMLRPPLSRNVVIIGSYIFPKYQSNSKDGERNVLAVGDLTEKARKKTEALLVG
jgi:hypothetical protein